MLILAAFFGLSFSLPSSMTVMAETSTYTTDIALAPWRDRTGSYDQRTDYAKAPFYIEDGDNTILFSAGCHPTDASPRIGSHNAASYTYHDFDHEALASFRSLTTNQHAAVMVLDTPLMSAAVTAMTFSWAGTTGGAQDVHYIYSYDGGVHWHIADSDTTQVRPRFNSRIPQGQSRPSRRLVDIRHHFLSLFDESPVVDRIPQPDTNGASRCLDGVGAAYSPCLTDDQDLLHADAAVAASFMDQYDLLTIEAQAYFNQGMIDATTSHRERLDFILSHHQLELMALHAESAVTAPAHESLLVLMAIVGVLGYAAGKRKKQRHNSGVLTVLLPALMALLTLLLWFLPRLQTPSFDDTQPIFTYDFRLGAYPSGTAGDAVIVEEDGHFHLGFDEWANRSYPLRSWQGIP
jgi:hypothetical protein